MKEELNNCFIKFFINVRYEVVSKLFKMIEENGIAVINFAVERSEQAVKLRNCLEKILGDTVSSILIGKKGVIIVGGLKTYVVGRDKLKVIERDGV